MKGQVRELWSSVREHIAPTLDGFLRNKSIDVHNVQFQDGSTGSLHDVFERLGVEHYDDLWRIETDDLTREGVTSLWASVKLFGVRPMREQHFSAPVLNAETWSDLISALGLDSSAGGPALLSFDYERLQRRALKLVSDEELRDSNAEVQVLMNAPFHLKLCRARELVAAAAQVTALSRKKNDPILEAANAKSKIAFLRALKLHQFADRIGYTKENAMITMEQYTDVYRDAGDAMRLNYLTASQFELLRDGSRAWHRRQLVLRSTTIDEFCAAIERFLPSTIAYAEKQEEIFLEAIARMCAENMDKEFIFQQLEHFGVTLDDDGRGVFLNEARAWWTWKQSETPTYRRPSVAVATDPPTITLK